MKKSVLLFTVLSLVSCVPAVASKNDKFVFSGFHGPAGSVYQRISSAYILKNGKISALLQAGDAPVFSPEGTVIAVSVKNGITLLKEDGGLIKNVDLSGRGNAFSFSADGKTLYYTKYTKNKRAVLWSLDLVSYKSAIFLDPPAGLNVLSPSVSPDSKKILYELSAISNGAEGDGLYVSGMDGLGEKLISRKAVGGGWFPDSKHVFFLSSGREYGKKTSGRVGAIFKMNIETEEIVELEPLNFVPINSSIKLSRDGKFFYTSLSSYESGGYRIVKWPVGHPEKLESVTQPVKLKAGYTSHLRPDWWQGESG